MPGVSIGITAMELFAYNPFRILGIPVNASHAEIKAQYEKLLALANTGDINNFTTPFDFDSLPPFSRSTQTIKTAHAKLASNGYRCFAYSDGQFTVSLSIDDIMLNLRDISCYDCFLRCYMWLVINDREMQEHDLWIMLANYIDKLIMSEPEEWEKYFDNRFPAEMVDDNMLAYKSFYSTFCEIILLPLKEMVRGSMKCRCAKEILECAGIDVNETFETIDIPQANASNNGGPQPKLKLAVKYGEEFFDISTGTMRSYDEQTASNESNSFSSEVNAPLDADIFTETEEESSEELTEEYTEEPEIPQEDHEEAPAFEDLPEEESEAPVIKLRSRAEMRAEREAASAEKAPIKPTELVAPKVEPLKLDDAVEATPSITPRSQRSTASAVAPAPASATEQTSGETPRRQRRALNLGGTPNKTHDDTAQTGFTSPFMNKTVSEDVTPLVNPNRRQNTFTSVVHEAAEAEKDAINEDLRYEGEDEETYTNALVEILKSSSIHSESMKSVDTSHIVSAKEMAGPSHTTASMDAIDMKKYDVKRLSSSANAERKMTREERYRNIKIDDMLGTNAAQGKNYGVSAIDEYKKSKEAEKKNLKSLLGFFGAITLIIAILLALFWLGILG